jgi:nucleoside-diphosphate-sugar epimerase
MQVMVTGSSGFIARNLVKSFQALGHEIVPLGDANVTRLLRTGEMCVHRNPYEVWAWHLKNLSVDVVIHNAAVVGTDVVALNPNEATLTNMVGSYNLAMASKIANVPICYMGTTVIYDTVKYQKSRITEKSDIRPTTLYGSQKLAGEYVITSHAKDWLVMRPLFAYGGVGDMNSLIAKTIYACLNGQNDLDMFLDPGSIKDYLHVEDFCDAVAHACDQGLWGDDFNVASENPHVTQAIVDLIDEVTGLAASKIIKWHPETDYLGNHMLSSKKFRRAVRWTPKISLREGIQRVHCAIDNDEGDYNPLVHLTHAKERGIDLTQYFNSTLE